MAFVITGTPRSATKYAAELMKQLGIACTHERVFRPRLALDELIDWFKDKTAPGESSWLAFPWFRQLAQAEVPVVLQVRDPWKTIDSLAHRNWIVPAKQAADDHMHSVRKPVQYFTSAFEYDEPVQRAAQFWLDWLERIETEAQVAGLAPLYTYRVEWLREDPAHVLEVLRKFGIYRDGYEIKDALERTSTEVNTGTFSFQTNIKVIRPEFDDLFKAIAPQLYDGTLTEMTKADRRATTGEIEAKMTPEQKDAVRVRGSKYGYVAEPQEVCHV